MNSKNNDSHFRELWYELFGLKWGKGFCNEIKANKCIPQFFVSSINFAKNCVIYKLMSRIFTLKNFDGLTTNVFLKLRWVLRNVLRLQLH